jgi:hypothetical protein
MPARAPLNSTVRRRPVASDDPTAKIALRGPDGEIETLWAVDLGQGRFRLDNTPWYAYGISWQDVVEAQPDEGGQLQFVKLISKSGNRTVRITAEQPFTDKWLEKVVSLGATYEGANRRYIGISVPPETNLDVVTRFLIAEGVTWEYADPTYEEVHGRGPTT